MELFEEETDSSMSTALLFIAERIAKEYLRIADMIEVSFRRVWLPEELDDTCSSEEKLTYIYCEVLSPGDGLSQIPTGLHPVSCVVTCSESGIRFDAKIVPTVPSLPQHLKLRTRYRLPDVLWEDIKSESSRVLATIELELSQRSS